VGTPTASGPYSFTITSWVEGASPETYSYEFTGLVRYASAHTVTFNGNGATSGTMAVQSSDIKAALRANEFSRVGYSFAGWSTNPTGGGSVYTNGGIYEFATNVTLFAQWTQLPPVPHTVTFNGNGATGGSMAPQTSAVATQLSSNTFVRAGYTFNGWSTNPAGGGSVYSNNGLYEFAADITLFAQWVAIPPDPHTVTFDGNGATVGSMLPQTSAVEAVLTTNTFVRAGYTFNGWSTNPAGGGSLYLDHALYAFSADVTLYAQWVEIPPVMHFITFNGNGATGGAMANQGSSAPAVVSSNQFVREGYIFEEWNTQANAGGSIYYPGDLYTFVQDVTLYAIWKLPVPSGGTEVAFRTITYDGNGATGGETISQTNRGQGTIRENGFVRPGYVFHAWNSTPDHSGFELMPGDLYNFGADLTLYAQWDKIPPAAVVITVDKPLVIDLLAGEVRTIIVKVANTSGELVRVTFEIPAGMIKVNSRIRITPRTTVESWAAGVIDLQVDFTDTAGKDISVLDAVLEIQFTTKLGLNTVGKSEDGRTWVGIPILAGKTLPLNQIDGYYLTADGAAVILTRHLTEFGYKKGQIAALLSTASNSSLPVGLTTNLKTTGGNGRGLIAYQSLTPLLCSVSPTGLVKAVKVGTCSVSVTRNGDEIYVQSAAKIVKITVTPGLVVLAVQKSVVAKREVVVAATKVQFELGKANANKTVGVEVSSTSNGLYTVVGTVKLDKTGAATFSRKILTGTTIRVRYLGKTLTTYKFVGKL
jgi:uncharacterized repeat protein (TIGR02543 family)